MINQEIQSAEKKEHKIFLGGLPSGISKSKLIELLQPLGEIENLEIPNLEERAGGFATVNFTTIDSVRKALLQKTIMYKEREVTIIPYLKGKELEKYLENYNQRRVFVNDIPATLTRNQFLSTMSVFGNVDSGYLVDSHTKLKIGFLTYKTLHEAKKAVNAQYLVLPESSHIIKIHHYRRQVNIRKDQRDKVKKALILRSQANWNNFVQGENNNITIDSQLIARQWKVINMSTEKPTCTKWFKIRQNFFAVNQSYNLRFNKAKLTRNNLFGKNHRKIDNKLLRALDFEHNKLQ